MVKAKILSVFYFLALLLGSYGVIFYCMKITYHEDIFPYPWNNILKNILMISLVVLTLTFRFAMSKLSEMRQPNTQT